jgi:23S rRNA pseudouridine1911/1915/1917 synthase
VNVSSKVPAVFHGESLHNYLTTRFSYLSAEEWYKLIQEGRITCQGVKADPDRHVAKGDVVGAQLPDFDLPDAKFDYTIVYEDQWLIGVNKPAGLRVHSSGKFVKANLMYHLRHVHQPRYPEADLVNRLDADTSGLVLLARDKSTLSQLMRQFSTRSVVKSYLAVVAGRPEPADGTINLPIAPIREALIPRYGIDMVQGKSAVTHYKTLRPLSDSAALVELHPETGRTHQLRVHLASIGHPIVGDALYTMSDENYLNFRRNPPPGHPFQRQALHSHRLQFCHPVHQTVYTLTAPLTADMQRLIEGVTKLANETT